MHMETKVTCRAAIKKYNEICKLTYRAFDARRIDKYVFFYLLKMYVKIRFGINGTANIRIYSNVHQNEATGSYANVTGGKYYICIRVHIYIYINDIYIAFPP